MYFGGIPVLEELFAARVMLRLPLAARLEHMHVVAGTGHGKTELLKYLMTHDYQGFVSDEGIIRTQFCVIDSQGDLVDKLAHYWPYTMCYIDPTDYGYVPAINLFGAQLDAEGGNGDEILNTTISLYKYVFGALLGAELTPRQSLIFGYLARLMLHIPESTLATMIDVVEDPAKDTASARYGAEMEALGGHAAQFFRNQFFSRDFRETKATLLARLYGLMENETMARIFCNTENTLDFDRILNGEHIINVFVNTAKSQLQAERSALFGRFVIAMILQAAVRRSSIPENKRRPFIVYIDEAWEYFDSSLEDLLNQARKYKVGIVFAHQNLGQLPDGLRDTVMSSTSIKMVGSVSSRDARVLANEMRCDRQEILPNKKYADHSEWTLYIRNRGHFRVDVPFGYLEEEEGEPVSDEEYEECLDRNRVLYTTPIERISMPGQTSRPTVPQEGTEESQAIKDHKQDNTDTDDDIYG